MSDPFFRPAVGGVSAAGTSFDAGLRAHMQRIFNYMAGGLVLTGLVAYLAAQPPLANFLYGTAFKYVVMFAPLAFALFVLPSISRLSLAASQGIFWGFSALMGLSLGTIFIVYSDASIARAFFASAATFTAMSLYGYVTKRNLTSMGAFMFMGLIGIFIASLVNIFLMSSALQWVVSIAGVVIFTGLTAYDVQRIKETYSDSWGREANDKLAISGALALYLDFINLFLMILRLVGNNRN